MNLIGGDDDEILHEQDRRRAHEAAMNRPVQRTSYLPRDQAANPNPASQLGIGEWTAAAFCIACYAYALASYFQLV